jgi:hypothetical protein
VTLWASGVAVSYSLEISSRSALNAYYERGLRQAARQTRQGVSLSDSLACIQLLPKYLLEVLAAAETAGDFGGLERFATILEDEAFTRASQQFMIGVAAGQIFLIIILVTSVFAGAARIFGVELAGTIFALSGVICALVAIIWFVCLITGLLTASRSGAGR